MKGKEKAADQSGRVNQANQSQDNKKLGKLESMLRTFAHGARLHRFQAERIGDHCLHTTVSDLQIRHSLKFNRVFVKVPNRFGSQTAVKEYWLDGESLKRAQEIVGLSGVSV